MPVGEKIRDARKNTAISQGELAKEIDVSLDTISRWETGKRTPRTEDLLRLSKVLNVSVSYLMGEAVNSDVISKESVVKSYKTPRRFKKEEGSVWESQLLMVPRISQEAKLLHGAENVTVPEMQIEVIDRYPLLDSKIAALYSAESLTCMTAEGDSMEPQIHDGDTVIFNNCREWFSGNIYAVCLDGKMLIKGLIANGRNRPPMLRSSNKDYPDIVVREEQFFVICGRVLKILTDRKPNPII